MSLRQATGERCPECECVYCHLIDCSRLRPVDLWWYELPDPTMRSMLMARLIAEGVFDD